MSQWCTFCILIIATMVSAACTSTPTPQQPPSPVPQTGPVPSIYEELLNVIPDSPETRSGIRINNYAQVRETLNVSPPEPNAGDEALQQYRLDTFMLGPWISGYSQEGSELIRNRDYLGFDSRHVDQSIEAGRLEAVHGRFDPTLFDRGIAACLQCALPVEEEYSDVLFYSWDDSSRSKLRRRFSPPAFDFLGRGGSIAVQDKYVFRTLLASDMKTMIDASLDQQPSLADFETFTLIARGLAKLEPYTVRIGDETLSVADYRRYWEWFSNEVKESDHPETREHFEPIVVRFWEDFQKAPALRPYDAFAIGHGRDTRGCFLAIVLVHANEVLATENIKLLTRRIEGTFNLFYLRFEEPKPWHELVDSMEIHPEGRALLAKLHLHGENEETAGSGFPQSSRCAGTLILDKAFERDPLLMHE